MCFVIISFLKYLHITTPQLDSSHPFFFSPYRSGGELNTSHARESHQIGRQRLLQASPLQGWVRHEGADMLTDTRPLSSFTLWLTAVFANMQTDKISCLYSRQASG